MQTSLTATKPFVAATAATRAPRAAGRALTPVRAAAGEEAELAVPRRALAGLLAAAPVLLPASRALALIPDDDDEELVERARANRAQRLASERQTQQAFARSSKNLGACGGPEQTECSPCPCTTLLCWPSSLRRRATCWVLSGADSLAGVGCCAALGGMSPRRMGTHMAC